MDSFNRIFPLGRPAAAGPESHFIPAGLGKEMVAQAPEVPDYASVTFHAEAVKALLEQEGAKGIRLRFAHNGHHATLVGFAVDANDEDIAGPDALAIENGERCPPLC